MLVTFLQIVGLLNLSPLKIFSSTSNPLFQCFIFFSFAPLPPPRQQHLLNGLSIRGRRIRSHLFRALTRCYSWPNLQPHPDVGLCQSWCCFFLSEHTWLNSPRFPSHSRMRNEKSKNEWKEENHAVLVLLITSNCKRVRVRSFMGTDFLATLGRCDFCVEKRPFLRDRLPK